MHHSLNNNIKISIITIVFNNDRTLEGTIESVLNQTYPNIEYIIVDGGSTDNTLSIIKKYEQSIKWISEPDRGISDAFNKGILMSSGDLIGIINADDWYEKDAIEIIVENLEDEIDVYCGNIRLIDKSSEISKYKKSKISWLSLGMHVMHPSVFVKRSVYNKVGLFNIDYKIAMDYDMLLRIRRHSFRFKYIDRTIANMRLNGASSDVKKMHAEELKVMRNNLSGSSFILAIISNYTNRFLYYFFRLTSRNSSNFLSKSIIK